MIKNFIYRETGAGGTGGAAGLSLADIETDETQSPEDIQKEKEIADLAAQKLIDDAAAEAQKKADDEAGKETPEQKADREAAEKLELEKKEKSKDDKLDDTDPDKGDEDEAEVFMAEVDALRGDTLDVDYGDVDPLSPAGVVLREKAVEEAAIDKFEAILEDKYPKAYAFLLHTQAGKPEEEFFGKATSLDTLPTVGDIEASVETQKAIVLQDLLAKGNSEKHAGLIIKSAVEENELEEMAKAALTSREKARDDEMSRIKSEGEAAMVERQTAISEMATYIDKVVATGQIGNIVIPEKERTEFASQFKKSIRYESGKFLAVTELTNENLQDVFGKEFFAFKKGDLGQVVAAAAKTQNAIRLKRTIPEKKVPSGGAEDKNRQVTLGELDAD